MLERLLTWERECFLAINGWHTPVLDRLMPVYTDMWLWVPFFLILVVGLAIGRSKKEWVPMLIAFLAVVLVTTVTTSLLVKPFFQRLRPTHHPDFMYDVKTVLEYVGEGKYGFISGHSTFSFAMAMFTTLLLNYKPYGWMIFSWASLVVYSRLYLGVHFLTDVIPGMLVGMLIGWVVYRLYSLSLFRKGKIQKSQIAFLYPKSRVKPLTVVLAGYIFLVIVYGAWM